MLIYVGKLNYSPYASDEVLSIVFRDNVQNGDRVAVISQWSKDASGKEKANFTVHGTVSKVTLNNSGQKDIEILSDEKSATYYWYKGKMTGDKMTLSMLNKSGEEVAKNIELQLFFF
ncbi:hypothetical protein N7462_008955 [Penicillium macrosclerotiorum]|uniref:uncharacterized protein n=1 Tax=Penicillium macrosclerotiorum TaxID=303699 RepID=UPI002546C920|nr:uncharacterized protein N7462_008955 [Penicillium macrosclerotiorum]KAJ5676058.1 hypothetical protein N7462_008955 [Penicillium macrosclerotiorum]